MPAPVSLHKETGVFHIPSTKDANMDSFQPGPENTQPSRNAVPCVLPFRKRRPVLFWGGLFLLFYCLGSFAWSSLNESEDNPLGTEYLAVVRIEGFIGDTRKTLNQIERLRRDKRVKGVLLRINSPGGGAAASHELYDALKLLAAVKPVCASMGSVAASGGLMVASAAQYIFALPTTITGSIGVKMEIPQLAGIMDKLGLQRESIVSGKYKDAGTPFRPMSPEERDTLTGIVAEMHENFVKLLVKARKLPEEQVRAVADGRILTGETALHLGFVDALGGQSDALFHLRAAAQVAPYAKILEQNEKTGFLRELLLDILNTPPPNSLILPEFFYMY